MERFATLLEYIALLGAGQGVLLAAVLLTGQRGNRRANRYLAGLMLALSVHLVVIMLGHGHFPDTVRHSPLLGWDVPVIFLYGPFAFLYIRTMTAQRAAPLRRDLWHGLLAGLVALYMVPLYLSSAGEKTAWFNNSNFGTDVAAFVMFSSQLAVGLAYIIATVRLLRRHARNIKEAYSSIERINLRWVWRVLLGMAGIWAVAAAGYVASLAYSADARIILHYGFPLAVALLIYWMGYMGLRQPALFTGHGDLKAPREYEKSTLQPALAEKYARQLTDVMETEKPFTDQDLMLPTLAARLAMPTHHLSQVINERFHLNFFDFVNRYRIEEAKRRLLNPDLQHLTILAIAYDVGFSSKSAFNAAFKKHTHTTPSEFRRNAEVVPDILPLVGK